MMNMNIVELCPNANAPSDALTRFGISANQDNAFNGDAMTIFYNHPGNSTIGDWPAFYDNGTAVNGGIPQLGDLQAHLAKVRSDIEASLPHNFSGTAIIDQEMWTPWIHPNAKDYYMNASLAYAGGDVDKAVAEWNASSLEFMAQTLAVAGEARPNAKWGPSMHRIVCITQRVFRKSI